MQIKTGTANTTANSNLVYATSASGADWSQVTVGSLFMLVGSAQTYHINAVSYNAGSSRWEATLAVNFPTTNTGVAYTIVRDFTFNYGLPLLASGDVETAAIFSRAMQLLDVAVRAASLSGGGDGGDPTPYNKVAHGFVVGSALRIDSSGVFQLATSDSEVNSRIVGIVSEVPTTDTFFLQTNGLITSIGTVLTPGAVYWLRNTAVPFNLSSNTITDITLRVPVLVAVGAAEGLLFGMATPGTNEMVGASASVDGVGGTVPAPVAGDHVKFLRGDKTYASASPAAASLVYSQFATTPAFTTADWNSISGNASPANMLNNLNTRLRTVELSLSDYANCEIFPYQEAFIYTNSTTIGEWRTGTPIPTNSSPLLNGYVWKAPTGMTDPNIRAIAIGGGGGGGGQWGIPYTSPAYWLGGGGGGGEYREVIIPVTPGDDYVLFVGKGGQRREVGGPYAYSNSQPLTVGGNSYIQDAASNYLLVAKGGQSGTINTTTPADAGGVGGTGGSEMGTLITARNGLPGQGGFAYTVGLNAIRMNGGNAALPPYAQAFRYGSGGFHNSPGYGGAIIIFWR